MLSRWLRVLGWRMVFLDVYIGLRWSFLGSGIDRELIVFSIWFFLRCKLFLRILIIGYREHRIG